MTKLLFCSIVVVLYMQMRVWLAVAVLQAAKNRKEGQFLLEAVIVAENSVRERRQARNHLFFLCLGFAIGFSIF